VLSCKLSMLYVAVKVLPIFLRNCLNIIRNLFNAVVLYEFKHLSPIFSSQKNYSGGRFVDVVLAMSIT
jgi:hypothetical protein